MKIHFYSLTVGILLALASSAWLNADPLDHWHLRNPLPIGTALSSVAYGNGVYVAVGRGNSASNWPGILTSYDGVYWQARTNLSATSVVYGADRFVAVGAGASLVSFDGRDWIQGTGGPPSDAKIAFGNGLFVAAGGFGFNPPIFTSPDGLTWTNRTVSTFRLVMFEDVAYGNGNFLVTAYQFGGGNMAFTSSDGTTWTEASQSGDVPFRFTFAKGLFVGVAGYSMGVATSPDGLNWTAQATDVPTALDGIGFANGLFGVVGKGGFIATSPDATNWTSQTSGITNGLLAFGGGASRFVAVGEPGTIVTSSDVQIWTRRVQVTGISMQAIAYGSGLFVAVGYNYLSYRDWILTSRDGTTWTDYSPGIANELTAVTHGNGTFVALGTRPASDGLPQAATIIASVDGTVWTEPLLFPDTTLESAAYGNGVWVAVGHHSGSSDGVILSSTNGMNWTSQDVSGTPLHVAYGNGFFAVIGRYMATLTSADSASWTIRGFPPGTWAMTYGNGLFVVIAGENNFPAKFVYSSADAEHWTGRGYLGGVPWTGPGFAYGNGTFALLSAASGIAYTSDLDMPSWNVRLGSVSLRGVAYGRGTFVAVGDQGVILQSDPLPTARLSGGPPGAQGFPLTISGEEGLSYRLQASSDLTATNWIDLLTFTNTGPATNLVDTNATRFNQRFYRVVSP